MTDRLAYLATASFQAARRLVQLPAEHRAHRLHGHGFTVRVRAQLAKDWAPFPGAETDSLLQALQNGIAVLDYQDLNNYLAEPSDENLAVWLRDNLLIPGIENIEIQSTPDQGAICDAMGKLQIWRRFRFEAAHRLPNVPPNHPCGRMHGHGFTVKIYIYQDFNKLNCINYGDEIFEQWAPWQQVLDQNCLNDLPGLANPTTELLARWIWRRLQPKLPTLAWISVNETNTAGCHYDGCIYQIWKEQYFEGALRLIQAPEFDQRERLHGHSYCLKLYLSAPLDAICGWTIDYGDVKKLFQPVYERLDHHRLNHLPRLADADPASLIFWIREEIITRLPWLTRIDLFPIPGCGASLEWGGHGATLP